MVVILRLLAIIIAGIILVIVLRYAHNSHIKESTKKNKINTFIAGLPHECYLFVTDKIGSNNYIRGYYLRNGEVKLRGSVISFYGRDVDPNYPTTGGYYDEKNGYYVTPLNYITIPVEWVVNDLITVKYITSPGVTDKTDIQENT